MTRIALFALTLYGLIACGMYAVQRKLQYFPRTDERTPEAVGLSGVQQIQIKTPDGETLRAWHVPAPPGQPTVLYLHGNGGGISDRPRKIAAFPAAGFGILALSYRGYEGSTGTPTEAGLVTDALAAYNWLSQRGADKAGIMVLGESLGTGVAAQLAARRSVKAVALEAPYANAVDIGAQAYWFLPVRLLMKDQYRSMDHIAEVRAPLLIQHGRLDSIIPFSQGEKLFASANEPKQLIAVDRQGHELISDEAAWARTAAFFRKLARAD